MAARQTMMLRTIAILGAGWLGKQLIRHLQPRYTLLATTAGSVLSVPTYTYRWESEALPASLLMADGYIIAIPPTAGGREHYPRHMQRLIAQLPPTAQVLMISSTGIYPASPGCYDENSAVDDASPLVLAENAVRTHPHATILRSGGQYGHGRWPLSRAAAVEDKRLNFVCGDNLCAAIAALLDHPRPGQVYNLVEPQHPRWSEYLQRFAAHLPTPWPKLLPPPAAERLISGER
ncbi:MAG: hypothetical protein Q4D61_02375, partial [Cardiobacteriaceae bacterium]|nr:hypothetical protein [Cardiobacteriaceae bacterium]